jgi:AraC family transcriptional regulator of adaptative response / methylphosphotriester-DNA alkyltransferase methyltransferase
MLFTDEEMWRAVIDNDGNYDCRFFYAVKTVGVYCRPSCKSRAPLRKNVRYFETGTDAQRAGFRPCKRCRPDLVDFAPAADIARQAKELIDSYYYKRDQLAAEMKRLGVSSGHLAALFKRQYGMSPLEYLNQIRVEQAKKMLSGTDRPIIDIAGEIGFDSLPSFYGFFRKRAGATPKEYRSEGIGTRRFV